MIKVKDEGKQLIGQALTEAEAVVGLSRSAVSMVVTNPNIDDNPIVYVNDAFERMTGYSRSSIIGRNCRLLQGPDTNPDDVARLRKAITNEEEISIDLLNYRASGEPFVNRLIIAPVREPDGHVRYFIGIQKEMRAGDKSSQDDLDRQLQDVQKKVKEHLSMVIGMIRAQTRRTSAPAEFAALSRRIDSLQLLYEEINAPVTPRRGNRANKVDLGAYLSRVANGIAYHESRPGIRVIIDVETLETGVDAAARLGIILTEVLTNAFRHAFVGLERGLVEVRLSRLAEGGLRLTVGDDGVGIPEGQPWPSSRSMGGRILNGLIEVLDGTLMIGRGAAGTVVTIEVPVGGDD